MSAKKSKKERKVIISASQQLIGKIATDELVIHYERVYAKFIAERQKNLILSAQIYSGRVMLAVGLVLTTLSIIAYLNK